MSVTRGELVVPLHVGVKLSAASEPLYMMSSTDDRTVLIRCLSAILHLLEQGILWTVCSTNVPPNAANLAMVGLAVVVSVAQLALTLLTCT